MDSPAAVNVLSCCSGVGMLDLGTRLAVPRARTVCYVERETYCCEVLALRMEEGRLDPAPVWSDLATFDGRPWRGVVDCIAGGFPCQPWSLAGKREGTDDARWLWPIIANLIRVVGCRLVFLENVPGLISGGGLAGVLGDLASLGFDAEWGVFSAAEVGAPHRRERVFILALAHHHHHGREVEWLRGILHGERPTFGNNPDGRGAGMVADNQSKRRRKRWPESAGIVGGPDAAECGGSVDVLADSRSCRRGAKKPDVHGRQSDASGGNRVIGDAAGLLVPGLAPAGPSQAGSTGEGVVEAVGDPLREGLEGRQDLPGDDGSELKASERASGIPMFPPPPGDREAWARVPQEFWPTVERGIRGLADGAASRVDRLRAGGNGVVPLAASVAFRTLARRLVDR